MESPTPVHGWDERTKLRSPSWTTQFLHRRKFLARPEYLPSPAKGAPGAEEFSVRLGWMAPIELRPWGRGRLHGDRTLAGSRLCVWRLGLRV